MIGLFSLASFTSCALASAAHATTETIDSRVLERVPMAAWAVGLARLVSSSLASTDVLGSGHGFEVLWIAARSNATKVVDVEAIGDELHKGFVRHAVNEPDAAIDARMPIALGYCGACPQPAAGRSIDCDSAPEALGKKWAAKHHAIVQRLADRKGG